MQAMRNIHLLLVAAALFSCQQSQSVTPVLPFDEFRGDPGVARSAVSQWVEKGPDAIPELKLGLADDSSKVQRYCTEALAKITGQWGWNDGLLWQRSVEDAKPLGKPMMVLHLFGNFDEEFC